MSSVGRQSPETFKSAAAAALLELQRATRAVLEQVAPAGTNSLAVSRLMQIDKSLSWRICRFAAGADVFAASAHLPGDAGLRIFARAARAGTARMEAVEALERALGDLETLVRAHARNRASFRAMLAQVSDPGGEDPRVVEYRKGAFTANAAIWGIEAATKLKSVIITRGSAADEVDVGIIGGCFGLSRVRGGVSWPLFNRRITHQGSSVAAHAAPLDPATPRDALPLLAGRSTIRAEHLAITHHGHEMRCWLPAGDVGRNGTVDCLFGERYSSVRPRDEGSEQRIVHVAHRHDIPAERAILDVWVDVDCGMACDPAARLVSTLIDAPEAHGSDLALRLLPFESRARAIVPEAAEDPCLPGYAELLADAMRWMGIPAGRLNGHRLAIRYPALSTELVMAVEGGPCG
jgi:hypothetical protein